MNKDMPKCAAHRELAKKHLLDGVGRGGTYSYPNQIYIKKGEGCRFYDLDGNEYLDFNGVQTTLIHGYAHPEINKALEAQIAKGTLYTSASEMELPFAQEVARRIPSIEAMRFFNSGTEAVMLALQTARTYTRRPKIAKAEGCYHGMYDYATTNLDTKPLDWSANDVRAYSGQAYLPRSISDEVVVVPFNDLENTRRVIEANYQDIAALIVDPLPNRMGQVLMTREYAEGLRKICDDFGIVLICDEVLSFRIGYNGSQSRVGMSPDLTVLGKVVGGGFPVGVVGGKTEIMNVMSVAAGTPELFGSGTASANPMTMVAGYEALRLLTESELDRLEGMAQHLHAELIKMAAKQDIPFQITSTGSLLRIHFRDQPVVDYKSFLPTDDQKKQRARFIAEMLEQNVYVAGSGLIALSTPMGDEEIDAFLTAADHAFGKC